MKNLDKSFGAMYKQSLQFEELEKGIYELIDLSQTPTIQKRKGADLCESKYYLKIKNRKMNPKQLIGTLRSIIEYSNLEVIKNKYSGHITQP